TNPKNLKFIQKSILDKNLAACFREADEIFHFAADPLVKESAFKPVENFNENVVGTINVLEAARKADVKRITFASTSTVYGDARVIPTPESYPMLPISNYGASKLAGEAYVCSYAHTYGINSVSLRYANIFGPRSLHGVMHDFHHKLKKNKKKLEILGNGKQTKSYLYISDCINATLLCHKQKKNYDFFNIGSRSTTTALEIANMVCSYMKLKPKLTFTGGKRGWIGDVPKMLLDIKKLENIGWKEKIHFEQGLIHYLDWLSGKSNR
ncbi:GDP-mannose 4,6-dehydratase, partial [Candidatus Micrarchaeota archaeon]|nr:GDP-mannose 4,6-dehydratase [Candidatus Micrarchaeota archaeon]